MTHALAIVGFHRSGTSFAADVLRVAGLHLGTDLLGAKASNPYGHFEDTAVIALHDRLLRANGFTWQVYEDFMPVVPDGVWSALTDLVSARRLGLQPWGFKDPRATLFLPLWRHVAPEIRVVAVVRHPDESAASLMRRHADDLVRGEEGGHMHMRFWRVPDLAHRMWLCYNRALLRHRDAFADEVLVVGADTLAAGYPLIDVVEERWDVGLHPVDSRTMFDPGAMETTARQQARDRSVAAQVAIVWEQLNRVAVSA